METTQQLLQRGWQVHQSRDFTTAERLYRQALSLDNHSAAGWCYLGIALHDQKRFQEAVQSYEHALKLQPNFPVALNNLGNSLRYTGEIDRADACFAGALKLKPDYLNAYKNRGTLHVWTGSLEKGAEYYRQALTLNPNEAELHRNMGVIYLLQGRFEEGWQEYRWRWKVGDLRRPTNQIPVWTGQELAGKRILLTAEQGLGDTINFVRFAKSLRELGADTLVYCQPPLVQLLQTSPDLGPICANNRKLEGSFDYQASLLDVADILKVNASTIPAATSYLAPADSLLDYWRERLGTTKRKRIGIAWQGNPDHQADIFRSVPLNQFLPLDQLGNVDLFSFQNGFGAQQISKWTGRPITSFADSLDKSHGAFMDTAAIMCCMDAVVTSDTAIAHVAGALDVPTHVALNYMPDWRWLLEREDSPWYPSVRLHRQERMGQWESVFASIASAISKI